MWFVALVWQSAQFPITATIFTITVLVVLSESTIYNLFGINFHMEVCT